MDYFDKAHISLDHIIEKLSKPRVGSHVMWNSSGGKAYGNIVRIIYEGDYKVPNTKVTITAEKNDPVAVIDLHGEDHKPTGRMVAHKLSSIKRA